jgi:hypothetical protein
VAAAQIPGNCHFLPDQAMKLAESLHALSPGGLQTPSSTPSAH